MSEGFPLVPLGEVLTRTEEWVDLQPDTQYQQVTVRLWGQGVVLRNVVSGAEIAAAKRLVVHTGQFILSRIDARNGALGIVPASLDGAVVSNDFPAFIPDPTRLLPAYLGWLSRTSGFVDLCKAASEGTTNRVRLSEERFLAAPIPLPPLAEQRRIVARIEALAARIEEARGLRREATEEGGELYAAMRDKLFRESCFEQDAVGSVFDLINGRAFRPDEWTDTGRKIIRIQNLKYPDAAYNHFNGPVQEQHLVCTGDVLFAWSGQVVSLGAHIWNGEEAVLNQHIFNVKPRRKMVPRFVQEGFNALIDEMRTQVRGLEMFHIRKSDLSQLMFPVPSLAEQHRIVASLDHLRAKVDLLKQMQAETTAELDALLPAVLDKAFKGEL